MLADVDYFVRLPNGKIAILEIKTTNYKAKDHWWKDGEECVPVYYETQGRHYMAVMDIDEIFYCCLYGNNEDEVIIRHLYRDREYEQEMIYLEREFWHDHILTRIPPPYTEDGSLILEVCAAAWVLRIRQSRLSSWTATCPPQCCDTSAYKSKSSRWKRGSKRWTQKCSV